MSCAYACASLRRRFVEVHNYIVSDAHVAHSRQHTPLNKHAKTVSKQTRKGPLGVQAVPIPIHLPWLNGFKHQLP